MNNESNLEKLEYQLISSPFFSQYISKAPD